jgi:hypothetical protein
MEGVPHHCLSTLVSDWAPHRHHVPSTSPHTLCAGSQSRAVMPNRHASHGTCSSTAEILTSGTTTNKCFISHVPLSQGRKPRTVALTHFHPDQEKTWQGSTHTLPTQINFKTAEGTCNQRLVDRSLYLKLSADCL